MKYDNFSTYDQFKTLPKIAPFCILATFNEQKFPQGERAHPCSATDQVMFKVVPTGRITWLSEGVFIRLMFLCCADNM